MKLVDLKNSLIEEFFSENSNGLPHDEIASVLSSLGSMLTDDLSTLTESATESGVSAEPSKALKRFTDGRKATLSICEDIGLKKMMMFAAARVGTRVAYVDLTKDDRQPSMGNLKTVKEALKQAKQVNDEVYFDISYGE